MAVVPVFHGVVSDDGAVLQFDASEQPLRRGYLRKLAGKRVDVTVRVHRSKRSDAQNRWHWGVAIPLIAAELGYDKHEHERLHYALVDKCFGTTWDEKLQVHAPNVLHSAELPTDKFSEFMEWEVRFAAQELGIEVPLPDGCRAA